MLPTPARDLLCGDHGREHGDEQGGDDERRGVGPTSPTRTQAIAPASRFQLSEPAIRSRKSTCPRR